MSDGRGLVYFVHGYSGSSATNCSSTWDSAVRYFTGRGWSRSLIKTVGYYRGDSRCDVSIRHATTGTPIRDLAASLANYIYSHNTSRRQSVDIVAHSMGGLVARVALLGAAEGWSGFPHHKLLVGDVVTLGTPHQGVRCSGSGCPNTTQWRSMAPHSTFMSVLHAPANRLNQSWASGTDWSFVGSDEDGTVSGSSAIDNGDHANHKYRYLNDNDPEVSHSNLRLLSSGTDKLRYWHSYNNVTRETSRGWAPVKTAYNAAYYHGEW